MNIQIRSLGMVALMMATSAAYADARVSVDINPFGWGAPPPVVYAPPREYYPPPVVYYGGGHWGDRREGRDRDHGRDHDRGRSDHHGDGDRR